MDKICSENRGERWQKDGGVFAWSLLKAGRVALFLVELQGKVLLGFLAQLCIVTNQLLGFSLGSQ